MELSGRGVSYCATCDAAFFRDAPTLIIGGGDSAMEEAMFLSKFASKVAIVHRRDEFRASKIMLERARAIPNIEWLTPYGVEEFIGGDAGSLTVARLRNLSDGSSLRPRGDGRFHRDRARAAVAAGRGPGGDRRRRLRGHPGPLDADRIPGVFAAGDLVDHTYRQAVTAAGSGCQAALDAEWYLRDTPFPVAVDDGAAARRYGAYSYGQPCDGPQLPDGGDSCMLSAKSWVQVPAPAAQPLTAWAATPVPTLR